VKDSSSNARASALLSGVATDAASVPARIGKRLVPDPSDNIYASRLENSAVVAARTPDASLPKTDPAIMLPLE
jgi:hypothetical protein